MDGALPAHQQAGADLGAAGPQGKGGGQLPSSGDAAGGDHRQVGHLPHLGHQGHGGQLAHMAAALRAFGDEAIHPQGGQAADQGGGGDHGEYLDARLLPGGDILAGHPRSGGDHLDALLHHHLGHLGGGGVHQHDVHAEGFIGQGLAPADVLPQGVGIHAPRADQAQGPGVGHGGGEFAGGDVGHAALDQGKLGPQQFIQFHIRFSSPSAPSLQVRLLQMWNPSVSFADSPLSQGGHITR